MVGRCGEGKGTNQSPTMPRTETDRDWPVITPIRARNSGDFLQPNTPLIVIRRARSRPHIGRIGAGRLSPEIGVEFIKSVSKRKFPLELTDPQPLEKFEGMWRVAGQIALIGLFFYATIGAIEFARPILLPVVAAFMLGMMLGPLINLATRAGIPVILSAIVLWLLVIAIFYGMVLLLSAPLVEWAGKGPQLAQIIKEKLTLLDRPIAAMNEIRSAIFPKSGDQQEVPFSFVSVLQPAVAFVTPAIGQLIIFFGTLFFFLIGRAQMRQV